MEAGTAFNTLDYIVFSIILFSGLLALIRGLVKEILSLITWIGAFWVAGRYYQLAEPTVQHYISNKSAVSMGAGILMFVVSFIVLTLLGFLVSSLVRGRALTAIDRSLGFVFGILRGAFVVCVIYLAATSILYPDLARASAKPSADLLGQPRNASNNKEDTDKKVAAAPDFVLKARTRPALAAGAEILQSVIPQDRLDKMTKQALKQKQQAEQMVHDTNPEEMLTIPGITRNVPKMLNADDKQSIEEAINPNGNKR